MTIFLLRHKINENRSTGADLIGADDTLKYILWFKYLIEVHGYIMGCFILQQGNRSKKTRNKFGKNQFIK